MLQERLRAVQGSQHVCHYMDWLSASSLEGELKSLFFVQVDVVEKNNGFNPVVERWFWSELLVQLSAQQLQVRYVCGVELVPLHLSWVQELHDCFLQFRLQVRLVVRQDLFQDLNVSFGGHQL